MNLITSLPKRYYAALRDKEIKRAETRIIIAGLSPQDFTPQELEIVVKEEEDKLKSEIREKGLLAILALLGLSWFG